MTGFESDEGLLRFIFDERWSVLRWDAHPAHRKSMNALDKSKAIDFVGIYDNEQAFLIEVKDRRHYSRTNPESLWTVVESKVRNTVAGLVGAHRREEYTKECSPFLEAVCNKPLRLVLWLEAERPSDLLDARDKVRISLNTKRIKPHIQWIDAHVTICRLIDYTTVIPGLTVECLQK